jgi:hypothetical protein
MVRHVIQLQNLRGMNKSRRSAIWTSARLHQRCFAIACDPFRELYANKPKPVITKGSEGGRIPEGACYLADYLADCLADYLADYLAD